MWISGYLKPVSRNAYVAALTSAAKKAGIEAKISSHCLRASMLNYLVNNTNLNIHAVAYFGRHDVKVLVSRYSKTDIGNLFAVFSGSSAQIVELTCNSVAKAEEVEV